MYEDAPVRDDTLFDIHLTPSRTANSPSPPPNHDAKCASGHHPISTEENVPVLISNLFSAIGGSHSDGPSYLNDSWIGGLQIDNAHDDDHEISIQCAQPGRCADGVVSSSLLGEDLACQIPSEEDNQDNLPASNLNIDLDSEYFLH